MKNITTFLFIRNIFSLLILLFCFSINAQVGIGTTTPSESLDVIGNIEYTGALMPNNTPGNANEILLSGGVNSPSVWGPELLNTSQTTEIGKFYSGLFDISSNSLILTLTDPNCKISSTCTLTWIGLTPGGPPGPSGPNWGELSTTITAHDGYWIFYIKNNTGYTMTNMQFSFFAAY